jgi:hypothetical protein
MASSLGELTLVLEMRTLRQESISMPSRLVSIFRLSMVRLSTPVARMPKWPPLRMEKSRSVTLRQSFSAMALSAPPSLARQRLAADEAAADDGDVFEPSPQIRLL